MKKVIKRVLGDPQIKTLKRMKKRVKDVNELEATYKKLSDAKLKAQTEKLKERLKKESLDAILPDAFAIAREATRRVIGQRHYDVQLIGGMVLHEGSVAEMKTGEGKTQVGVLPAYLNALSGKGVHIVTVNEYLAQRDAGWMGQVHDFLGLSVGCIVAERSFVFDATYDNSEHDDPRMRKLRPATRQEAYKADITYGTNNEFGFDYLRDNMVQEVEQLRQRQLNFAIVDEVDSILIDEARTPLIISAPSVTSGNAYMQFAKVTKQLKETDYEKDEKRKAVVLTDEGIEHIEKILGVENLYAAGNIRTLYHLEQALKAETMFKRDKDYVVTKDGEVVIVDEHTGRLLAGRRYNEGLHQAIEAKENVEVQEESMTLATISFQNYFRLYDKLSGMTGTAETEAEEFHQIYKLEVVQVPPNRILAREDLQDRIYKTEMGKFRAIIQEIKALNAKGQPVLIGTNSIEKNEVLGELLDKAKLKHNVLNAKNNEKEASTIAKAGRKGAITLATNIAGRGTDIVLDEDAKKLGGLYVIGTERNESRRVDNQFRGRSGRQGDPGKTQFYVSTEDNLMRVFGGDRIGSVMNRLGVDDETPIENRIISKSLEGAQKKVEGFHYDSRKDVVKYDDVMNRHRKAIYTMRREILQQPDINKRIKVYIQDEVTAISASPDLMTDKLEETVTHVFPFDDAVLDRLFDAEATKFGEVLQSEAMELYERQESLFTPEIMRKVERDVYLQIMDNLWMQHLENMHHLREGITWASVGQRDPLVEYRRQSQTIFDTMQQTMRHEVVRTLFHAQPAQLSDHVETDLTRAARNSVDNADKIIEGEEFHEVDFTPAKVEAQTEKKQTVQRKKSRKQERKRKTVAKRRK